MLGVCPLECRNLLWSRQNESTKFYHQPNEERLPPRTQQLSNHNWVQNSTSRSVFWTTENSNATAFPPRMLQRHSISQRTKKHWRLLQETQEYPKKLLQGNRQPPKPEVKKLPTQSSTKKPSTVPNQKTPFPTTCSAKQVTSTKEKTPPEPEHTEVPLPKSPTKTKFFQKINSVFFYEHWPQYIFYMLFIRGNQIVA